MTDEMYYCEYCNPDNSFELPKHVVYDKLKNPFCSDNCLYHYWVEDRLLCNIPTIDSNTIYEQLKIKETKK
jgi:hypothetical protein